MKYEDLDYRLNASQSLDHNRAALRAYLLERIAEYEREPARGEEIAYEMAGLLGTSAVMHLAASDPYLGVLLLAGELELPPAHRSETVTWELLASEIRALPKR